MDASSSASPANCTVVPRAGGPPSAIRRAVAARLVGRSRAVRGLRQRIEGMAPLWIPVLLRGEPGSGRATVASLLHAFGPIATGELARIDAASLTPERRLPMAGTVYVEGVDRLPRRTQTWWLERLRAAPPPGAAGGVRWLASTGDGPSLRESAPDFDPELERLLARFAIRVPPLRERSADLLLLVSDLCHRIGRAVGREDVRFSPQALELLARCHWPGNVRELEEVVGRAIAFSPLRVIRRALVLDVIAERSESVGAMRADHALKERERLLAELRATGGNVARTAEVLGKSRTAVYRLIERHRIPLAWHRPGQVSRARGRGARRRGGAEGPQRPGGAGG
jgi:DNA-binding NtrC family response regulator